MTFAMYPIEIKFIQKNTMINSVKRLNKFDWSAFHLSVKK